jgi:hypothetical protein
MFSKKSKKKRGQSIDVAKLSYTAQTETNAKEAGHAIVNETRTQIENQVGTTPEQLQVVSQGFEKFHMESTFSPRRLEDRPGSTTLAKTPDPIGKKSGCFPKVSLPKISFNLFGRAKSRENLTEDKLGLLDPQTEVQEGLKQSKPKCWRCF